MKSEIRSMGEPEGVDIPPDRPRPFLDPSQHPFRSALLPCPTPPRGFHKAGLYGRFLMPRTDSLTAPLLPGKL
jgi:hypothetical protein